MAMSSSGSGMPLLDLGGIMDARKRELLEARFVSGEKVSPGKVSLA